MGEKNILKQMGKTFRLTRSAVAGGRGIKGRSDRIDADREPWGCVQLGFEHFHKRSLHHPSVEPLTTLTVKKVGSLHSDGASRGSACGRCLLSCHKAPRRRVWLLPPDHVLYLVAQNWTVLVTAGHGD